MSADTHPDNCGVCTGYEVPAEYVALAESHYSHHGNGLVYNLLAAVLPVALAEVTAERDRLSAVLQQQPSRDELPYTCPYCSNTLADHLLVFDLYGGGVFLRRVADLVCEPCGRHGEAMATSPHFKAVRLFRLTAVLADQQDGADHG